MSGDIAVINRSFQNVTIAWTPRPGGVSRIRATIEGSSAIEFQDARTPSKIGPLPPNSRIEIKWTESVEHEMDRNASVVTWSRPNTPSISVEQYVSSAARYVRLRWDARAECQAQNHGSGLVVQLGSRASGDADVRIVNGSYQQETQELVWAARETHDYYLRYALPGLPANELPEEQNLSDWGAAIRVPRFTLTAQHLPYEVNGGGIAEKLRRSFAATVSEAEPPGDGDSNGGDSGQKPANDDGGSEAGGDTDEGAPKSSSDAGKEASDRASHDGTDKTNAPSEAKATAKENAGKTDRGAANSTLGGSGDLKSSKDAKLAESAPAEIAPAEPPLAEPGAIASGPEPAAKAVTGGKTPGGASKARIIDANGNLKHDYDPEKLTELSEQAPGTRAYRNDKSGQTSEGDNYSTIEVTIAHPDGSRTSVRVDKDGSGTRAMLVESDRDGNVTTLVHERLSNDGVFQQTDLLDHPERTNGSLNGARISSTISLELGLIGGSLPAPTDPTSAPDSMPSDASPERGQRSRTEHPEVEAGPVERAPREREERRVPRRDTDRPQRTAHRPRRADEGPATGAAPGTRQFQNRLMRHEGVRPQVYLDTRGIPTVGVGFNLRRRDAANRLAAVGADRDEVLARRQNLTPQQIDTLLSQDVDDATRSSQQLVPSYDNLPPGVQGVLVEMVFQLGHHGVQRFRNTRALLDRGAYQDAAREMLRSDWAEQTPERAQELADIVAAHPDRPR